MKPQKMKIAFHSEVESDREIFLVNTDGSGLTQLTHNTADDYAPSLSRDGSKIVFESDMDGDSEIFKNPELQIVPLDEESDSSQESGEAIEHVEGSLTEG